MLLKRQTMLKRSLLSRLKRKPLKRAPLKKKGKVVDQESIDKMKDFFLSVWRSRPHLCTICGAYLGSEPRSYMFDHVIEKQSHPELKYEENNIALLCLSCHDLKTRGFYPGSYAKKIVETKKLFGVE